MFKNLLNKIWIPTVMIGTILFALGVHYLGISIITEGQVNYGSYTWTYYKIDIVKYISNVEETVYSIGNIINMREMPTPPEIPNNVEWINWIKFFVNMCIYMVNWYKWVFVDMFILAIKLFLYPIFIIGALLGINTSANGFFAAVREFYSFTIPNIQPI